MDLVYSDTEPSIPIVDFAEFVGGSKEQRRVIADSLVSACRSVGFVYIKNHGLSSTSITEAFSWSQKLYALPIEDKMKAPHPPGFAIHRGYSYPGLEKVSDTRYGSPENTESKDLQETVDSKETYEIGSEENPSQPNVWLPESVLPGYRSFMLQFYWEAFQTAKSILQALAIGIGLDDEDYLLKFHSGHNNQLRLAHYPSIPAHLFDDGSHERCPAHTDWTSITLLLQDSCGGLEIESPTNPGHFIAASPIPDTVIMNVGDFLQRWSNDTLTSTRHRVAPPPLQNRYTGQDRLTRERFSLVYFMGPDSDAVVEVLEACTSANRPAKYKPITWTEYNIMKGSTLYEEEK